jgi:hypothetical protein
VEYHFDTEFSPCKGELILFDEVDEFIYKSPGAFKSFISNNMIVCLTATRGG